MHTIKDLPCPVEETPHVWIELASGERLAARLWRPEGSENRPVPTILEYIPYRRRDYTTVRDQATHGYLAGHGFACLRVDVRGTGDSDGIHTEQWSDAYDRDALEVFDWITAQPWSDGQIAMMGLSWGGQTSLKMASLADDRLKCVIALSAADDRYENKYLGGQPIINTIVWGATMTAQNSRPPDPATRGEDWGNVWRHRLENTVVYAENWLSHPRRDAYWASGSVKETYADFACPVYSTGGAADPGYNATVPNLLENLPVPVKGLSGPWAHRYPHAPLPGPGMGFLQEALRWFERWMRGAENGIETEPVYWAWMHEFYEPDGFVAEKPGRWVAEQSWPPADRPPLRLHLNPGGRLDTAPGAAEAVPVKTPQSIGVDGGEWMPWMAFGPSDEMQLDQRHDDARSVTFDTAPLDEDMEILGVAELDVEVSCDKPVGLIAARLCDVAPDGTSLRVTYGVLNLTRRDSLSEPAPLEPGNRYRIRLPLYNTAHAFRAGHRIRVALSTGLWPIVWPIAEAATVTMSAAVSALDLPVRPRESAPPAPPFGEPEAAAPMSSNVVRPAELKRTVTRDAETGRVVVDQLEDGGVTHIDEYGLDYSPRRTRRYIIDDDDPTAARIENDWTWTYARDDWQISTRTISNTWCTAGTFAMETSLEAREGDDLIFQRSWRKSIPRDLM